MSSVEYVINDGSELRFEAVEKKGTSVVVKLVDGACEVFGTKVEPNRVYTFPHGSKAALASVGGSCTVRFMDSNALKVVRENQPFSGTEYTALLQQLNAQRDQARQTFTGGPRVLVCGQTDTGKSTLCKYLLNSAVKAGHSVAFLDGDLGQNSITCPGSIASVFLQGQQVDIEEGLTLFMPLAFFFGELTLTNENLGRYHYQCCQAAACIRANADNRKEFEAGGLVVNTMGWVEDLGYGALRCIVEAAQINTVIVMDNQLLQDKITDDFGSKGVVVHGFQRGGGVVERPKQYRKQQREERVAEYFKGVNTMLKPVKVCVPFSDLYLFTVGGAMAPDAPQNVPEFLQATLISPDPSLNLSVAAVSHAACREEIPHANVAGFVVILNVDLESQLFTLLLPSGNTVPRRFLITSKIQVRQSEMM